jgi:hypothetical protein
MSAVGVPEHTEIRIHSIIRATFSYFISGHQFLKDRLLAFYSQSAIGV